MKRKKMVSVGFTCLVLVITMSLCLSATPASAQKGGVPQGELPKHLVIGTFFPPTEYQIPVFNIWERDLGIPVVGKAVGGTPNGIPRLAKGQINVYFPLNAPESWAAFHGVEIMEKHGPMNIRTLYSLYGDTVIGSYARKGSGIKTLKDVAGKRVAVHSARTVAITWLGYAPLQWAGVLDEIIDIKNTTWGDRKAGAAEGRIDFFNGRYDSGWIQVKSEVPGVQVVSIPEACGRWVEERIPWAEWAEIGKRYVEKFDNQPGYTNFRTRRNALVMADASDYLAYRLTKAYWENIETLKKAHPIFVDFDIKMNVERKNDVPYHPGAIAYYREVGIWTAEDDAHNQKLLANQGKEKLTGLRMP